MNYSVCEINEADTDLAIELHGLNPEQLKAAEKLYYRSSRSWLACAKLIKEKSNAEART